MQRVSPIHYLVCWCLGAIFLAVPAHAEDCEGARALYDQARSSAEADPHAALRLLDEVTAQCPSAPHGWFLAGNIHRELGDHAAARAAYGQAADVAEAPRAVAVAKAYAALASFELGEVCEAQLAFRALVPNPGASVPAWLRAPWEAFSRAASDAEPSAAEIACVLNETASDRNLAVCPRIDLRIEFDYDSAEIRSDSHSRVEALARALARRADDLTSFRLIGHSDARGNADYNQRLSERRARSVLRAVRERDGRLAGRLRAEGKGEREPLIVARTEADHRVNRRVEVGVICGAGTVDGR